MERLLGAVTALVGNASNVSNTNGHHVDGHGAHHGDHGAVLLGLFFPFFALMFGAAIKHGLSPLGIPYTVNLTVAGWIVGFLAVSSEDSIKATNSTANLNEFYGSVKVFANLDPHLLLYVFLPALIFESAFSIEWHKFKSKFAMRLRSEAHLFCRRMKAWRQIAGNLLNIRASLTFEISSTHWAELNLEIRNGGYLPSPRRPWIGSFDRAHGTLC